LVPNGLPPIKTLITQPVQSMDTLFQHLMTEQRQGHQDQQCHENYC